RTGRSLGVVQTAERARDRRRDPLAKQYCADWAGLLARAPLSAASSVLLCRVGRAARLGTAQPAFASFMAIVRAGGAGDRFGGLCDTSPVPRDSGSMAVSQDSPLRVGRGLRYGD